MLDHITLLLLYNNYILLELYVELSFACLLLSTFCPISHRYANISHRYANYITRTNIDI